MSNKFLSLLLVLVMCVGFVVPAFANEEPALDEAAPVEVTEDAAEEAEDVPAEASLEEPADEPEEAKVGGFKADNDASGKDGKKLYDAIAAASASDTGPLDAANGEDKYTPESWARFKAAYDAAVLLKNKYEATGYDKELTKVAMDTAAANLQNAISLMDKSATKEDIAALEAVIAEAKEVQKTIVDTGDKLKTAITTAEDTNLVKAKEGDATDGTRDKVNNKTNGYIIQLQKAIKDAKENHTRARTVVITDAGKITATSPSEKTGFIYVGDASDASTAENDTIYFTVGARDDNKDDYHYRVTATYKGVTKELIGESQSQSALKGDPTNMKAAKTFVIKASFFGGDVAAFGAEDEVTITLIRLEETRYGGTGEAVGYTDAETVTTKTVSIKDAPPAKFDITTGGFVASSGAYAGKPADAPSGVSDSIYVNLNLALNNTTKTELDKTYGSYYWNVTTPKGVVTIEEKLDGSNTYKNFNGTALAAKLPDGLVAGEYKVKLVGVLKNQLDQKADVTKEVTINVPAVDTTKLEAAIAKVDALGDRATIEANYGPYGKVTKLGNAYDAAKKFVEAKNAAISTNNSTAGTLESNITNDTLTGTLDVIVDLTGLKAIIAEAEALNPDDYSNWYGGIMAVDPDDAAEQANAAKYYLRAAKDLYDEMTAAKPNVTKTKADVDKAIANLRTAIDLLLDKAGVDPEDTNGLIEKDGKLYYYKAGEVQKVGQFEYPEGSGTFYYAKTKDDGHILKGGWITGDNGKMYYANAAGKLLTGYQVIGSDAYYFSIKDGHKMTAAKGATASLVSAGGTRQYVVGADGKLLKDLQTVGANSYYCSVKDHHIFKAVNGTAIVTGTKNRYQINQKGVVTQVLPLSKG